MTTRRVVASPSLPVPHAKATPGAGQGVAAPTSTNVTTQSGGMAAAPGSKLASIVSAATGGLFESVWQWTARMLGELRAMPLGIPLPRTDFIVWAVAASILVHAMLLALQFRAFDPTRQKDRMPPLEVALVNAKSKDKPMTADVLAQANLDGGGNTDLPRRAKTPLPAMPKATATGEIAVASQRLDALEQEARELMTRIKGPATTAPAVPKPVEAPPEPVAVPSASEMMQRTLESMRIEARIAKDIENYQQRPKRKYVGARAEEYRLARYVEDWRAKIERVGNLNYPEAARNLQLYGNLLLTVSIRSDGSVENVEINRSSGQPILDAAAVKIVQMSAPFAAFPPDIKRDTDVLHITRTWMFTKGDKLTSE
jgi:protein TonB